MKKTTKLISILLISTQMLAASPITVFADHRNEDVKTVEMEISSKKEGQQPSIDKDNAAKANDEQKEENSNSSEQSNEQGESKETEQPERPEEPKQPEQPEQPEKPKQPEQPERPKESEEPKQPEQPTKTEEPKSQPDENANNDVIQPAPEATPEQASSTAAVEQPSVQPAAQAPNPQFTEVPETPAGAIHFERNETAETFIRKIGEQAREVAQDNDLYASVMIAQAMLESGNGSSQLSSAPYYNLFGIKGDLNGKSVSFATQEDSGQGNMITIQAAFRAYDSYEDSLKDYSRLLKEGISGNRNFYAGAWKSNTNSYEDATAFLTGKYATDTKYNQKLNGLIETYDLTEYDKEAASLEVSNTGFVTPVANYTISSNFGIRGGEFHRGLDFATASREPIRAAKAGRVTNAEYHYSWGNYVTLEHDGGLTTLYAHQSEYIVEPGEIVNQGQIIGYVGSTGNSTGAHLHLEICSDKSLSQDKLIDPAKVLFE